MKKTFNFILTIIAALSLTLTSCKQEKKMVLKLGHVASPNNPYGQGADYFAKLVEKKSKGQIQVKVFPSSKLGGQKQLIEGLIYGTVDMALTSTAVLGQFQPQIALFDLPFLFKDRKHAYRGLDTVGIELTKPLEPRGIKLLGFMENGIKHLTNSVKEVRTPKDMKGMKIRVMDNDVYKEMIKSLGALPMPTAFSEVYAAMANGTVDGQENPSAHIFTKKYYEVQKFASLTGHAYAPEPLLISMKKWRQMSGKERKLIAEAAKEAIAWQRELSKKQDEEFWEKIKATGKMKVIAVNRAPFEKATKPVYKKMEPIVGAENIKKVKALIK